MAIQQVTHVSPQAALYAQYVQAAEKQGAEIAAGLVTIIDKHLEAAPINPNPSFMPEGYNQVCIFHRQSGARTYKLIKPSVILDKLVTKDIDTLVSQLQGAKKIYFDLLLNASIKFLQSAEGEAADAKRYSVTLDIHQPGVWGNLQESRVLKSFTLYRVNRAIQS